MELNLLYSEQVILFIFAIINIVSFLVMAHDKRKSVRRGGTRRTPEGLMFFMATIFGGIGIYLAMVTIRHKTRKWYFQLGIPLLIIQNLTTVYLVWTLFMEN